MISLLMLIDCDGVPSPPPNAILLSTNLNSALTFPPGTTASYDCLPGFQLEGDTTITCVATGGSSNWEMISFSCDSGEVFELYEL